MKRSALSLLAAILLFAISGCTFGEEDNTDPNSGFVLNDTLVLTQFAIQKDWTGGTEIAFTNMGDRSKFSGSVNSVQFLLDTLVDGKTYTYMPSDSSAFDKNSNFDMALLYRNVTYKDGKEVIGTGQTFTEPTAGTLSFAQGDGYRLYTYTLEFGKEKKISGYYKGLISIE